MAIPKKKTSLGLISLMLLSLFSALLAAPSATAIEQIDLAILSGQSPVEDRYYPAFDPITFPSIVEYFDNKLSIDLSNPDTIALDFAQIGRAHV